MFREVARKKQALCMEECVEILTSQKRGVLAVAGDGGYPYALPINHFYCEEDGRIYFHSGGTGHKIDSILREPKMSFCVTDGGRPTGGGPFLTFRSVIVFGRAEIIEDREKIYDVSRRLSLKFTDDEDYISREIEKHGPRTFMFALVPEHVTGKTVREE